MNRGMFVPTRCSDFMTQLHILSNTLTNPRSPAAKEPAGQKPIAKTGLPRALPFERLPRPGEVAHLSQKGISWRAQRDGEGIKKSTHCSSWQRTAVDEVPIKRSRPVVCGNQTYPCGQVGALSPDSRFLIEPLGSSPQRGGLQSTGERRAPVE